MNARVLLLATLVVGSVLVAPAASARAPTTVDSVVWGAPGSPVQASPGESGKLLSVTIRNQDTASYTNLHAVLGGVPGAIAPVQGSETATLSGAYAQGDAWVAKFYVNVASGAQVGTTYMLPLTVTMTYRGSATTFEDDLAVGVTLTGHPTLALSASPATLPVGEETDVVLSVTNTGNGPASGVSLTLNPAQGSGLALVRTENVRAIGSLAAGETRATTVRMRASVSGTPTLGALLAYDDAAGAPAQESRTLYFDTTNTSDAPLTTEVLSHTITKGQNGDVTLRVRNTGASEVRDVSVVAEPAQGSALTLANQAAPTTVATLAPNATLDFTTRFLSTSAQTDVASIVATVTWSAADGTSHSRTSEHGLRLWNADLAAIGVRLVEDHLDSGRAGTLTFVVTNNESSAVRGLTATLQPPTGTAYTVRDASDTVRLGDVQPSASASMVTNVITSNGATGLQRLVLQLAWQDVDGTPRTQTYDFGIAILGTVDFQVGTATGTFDATSGSGSITATVTNLGNAIAHNVYVSLLPSAGYAGTQETYLGDINPNTANPFTLQTTLVNLSLLQATGNAGTNPGGFGGGRGNGTFPGGGVPGGAGGRGGGNATRGGFGAATSSGATAVLRWNDEYGASHTAPFTLTLRPRAASTASGTASTASRSTTNFLPGIEVAGALAAIAVAAGVALVVQRRKER